MTDTFAELDAALDRAVAAARAHLAAVKAADGEPDDDAVWNAYVALNNASHEYDELLNDVFGEVTPWDLEAISAEEAHDRVPLTLPEVGSDGEVAPADDPYPYVVSVRQRRDYRVPSVAALLRVAQGVRVPAADVVEPVATVAEAIADLLQSGDGSLAMLDRIELDPLDGVVVLAEVAAPLDPDEYAESDGQGPFQLTGDDRVVGRLDERAMSTIDE